MAVIPFTPAAADTGARPAPPAEAKPEKPDSGFSGMLYW